MSSYAASPTRQRFLARFEANGEDYLYRRTSDAAPVRISAQDHKFMVNEFDSSWLHFPYVAAFAAACAALFTWIAVSPMGSSNSHILRDMILPISALWFVGAWYADLWDIPDRALFQRARDIGKTRPISWLTKSAGNMSWRSTTIYVFFLPPPFAGLMFANEPASFLDKFFFGLTILGVALILLVALRKLQISQSGSFPYLNELN